MCFESQDSFLLQELSQVHLKIKRCLPRNKEVIRYLALKCELSFNSQLLKKNLKENLIKMLSLFSTQSKYLNVF